MADPNLLSTARPDIDIHADVNSAILQYPPLAADHFQIHIVVNNGIVKAAGHVKSAPNRRQLLSLISTVEGVSSVNGEALYDEDTLRLEVGKVTPFGVQVNMRYGTAILSGTLPDGVSEDDVIKLASIPGVERVITNF